MSNRAPEPPAVSASDHHDALVAALVEVERHIGQAGWDQPPRLFALVLTEVLATSEPALAAELGLRTTAAGAPPAALTAVEQEDFDPGTDLGVALAGLEWPDTVFGCALALERTFLPAHLEDQLPADLGEAAQVVARHPERQDIRVVVGADRSGAHHGVARLVSRPEELLGGPELVPDLSTALAHTLF
jgi:hypothetical protein